MGVQRRHVPHFKGLIYAKVDLEAQGRDSTFTICHALVKKAILHLKRGFVQTHLLTIVHVSVSLVQFCRNNVLFYERTFFSTYIR